MRWVLWALMTFMVVFNSWGIETASAGALRIGVAPTRDRWLTFADGGRVFLGSEISYLLAQAIHQAGTAEAVLLDPAKPTHVDFVISPTVEALVYSSGSRSNRQVLGFTPEFSTPFDENTGGLENEFVATPVEMERCQKLDFFEGSLNPSGWGPFKSNFGVNADEGVRLKFGGYGVEFRARKFQVRAQVKFEILDAHTNTRSEVVVDLNSKGRDTFVGLAYQGIDLGVEVQRRKTLLAALQEMIPQLIEEVQSHLPISQTFASGAFGKSEAQSSLVQKEIELDLQTKSHAQEQAKVRCLDKKEGLVADILSSLLSVYGWIRYKTVYDQEFQPSVATNSPRLRIALIDSGVDPKNSKIQNHLVFENNRLLGYDFTSWDTRPSDDNGHGTAAALYLIESIKTDFELLPYKVVGGRGETTSSAIYASIREALRHQPDAILIPLQTQHTQALTEAIQLALDQGVHVFSATPINLQHPALHSTESSPGKAFKTKGLGGAKLKLDSAATNTIQNLKTWIHAQKRGKE